MKATIDKPTGTIGMPLLLLYGIVAAAIFHLSSLWQPGRVFMLVFFYFTLLMARAATDRQAFYTGLGLGFAIFVPQLSFFYGIFGSAAVPLWAVLSFWVGLFLLLARRCRKRFGDIGLAVLAPFLWTGLEYFRSELYYLRFSWLSAGFSFTHPSEGVALLLWGVYGIGFLLTALAGCLLLLSLRVRLAAGAVCLAVLAAILQIPEYHRSHDKKPLPFLKVAGIQAEFPGPLEVPGLLDKALRDYPKADLIVMSEYTFDGPVPERVKAWCARHKKHLIVGGKEPAPDGQFVNTAYVVGPDGRIVFRQGKAVPIQFFKDGLPAPSQNLWDSPWGKLGLCICYDLGYRRVVERLARQGARAIVVPTMDLSDWGEYEHYLHARVAPARAKEFGVPIIRLASSGISQWVDGIGSLKMSAPFPGEQATLYGVFELNRIVRFPLDRWLAPLAGLVTLALAIFTLPAFVKFTSTNLVCP